MMDRETELMLNEVLEKKMKEVQTKSVLAGGRAACEAILERIEKAGSVTEAIESVKKFCNASINLQKAQDILAKEKGENK